MSFHPLMVYDRGKFQKSERQIAPEGPPFALTAERREQLFKELTQLEQRRRDGAVSAERFATRRRRLVADLEQIYGEIDGSAAGPRGGGEGVAA